MNDFFNIKRFWAYTAKTYKENKKRYLIYTALMAGVMLAIILMMMYDAAKDKPALVRQAEPIMFLLFIFGAPFIFSEMRSLRNRHTAQMVNTLPVSTFERYMFLLLNTTIVYALVFSLCLFLTNMLLPSILGYGDLQEYFSKYNNTNSTYISYLVYMLFSAGLIFAGTTKFKNHQLGAGITFVIFLIIFIAPLILSPILNEANLTENFYGPYFNGISPNYRLNTTTIYYSTRPLIKMDTNTMPYQIGIWTLLFWVTSYFKLKERQIK